jgi:multidrug efflux system membrane fusion protein
MEASNPFPHQPGGMSATMRVPLASESAHKVSPALLSLSDAGVLGIKSVDQNGTVQFHKVEIIKSERDGLWLGGLPDEIDLISVGQGFVRAGDHVEVKRGQ